ncbi:MAG TPA: TonB-dependent receptor, partial [Flavipsychrobacter sp.]|nr:TonB-dependent receptor [Flavipsychrobacter sp.]
GGSYGYYNLAAEANLGDSLLHNTIRYQRVVSNGYREHSAMQNDIVSYDMLLHSKGNNELQAHALAGFLNYETPGALIPAEYERYPRMARPSVNGIPGAEENKAAIKQNMVLGGLSYKYYINDNWAMNTGIYSVYTQLTNPAIRNYTQSTLPHYGGRTHLAHKQDTRRGYYSWLLGAEFQLGNSTEITYLNNKGLPGSVTEQRNIQNINFSGFTQLTWNHRGWLLQSGLSMNHVKTRLEETFPAYALVERTYNIPAPRVAVLYKIARITSVYASVARGYTSPNSNELAPTGSYINTKLRPVNGWNYETGLRGYLLNGRLYYDMCGFYFTLDNTIVQRRDSAGGDYYINGGGTRQLGLEMQVNYRVLVYSGIVNTLTVEAAYTKYDFRYRDFMQFNNDYSGNYLPGIPANAFAMSVDLLTTFNAYLNLNLYYNDIIPLSDNNSIYDHSYALVNIRIGYRYMAARWGIDVFTGCNNLLNENYSLGNDVNAAGNRFYNVAPGINYFGGVLLSYKK